MTGIEYARAWRIDHVAEFDALFCRCGFPRPRSSLGQDVDTIVEERASVLGFARRYAEGVAANLRAGRLSAEAATTMQDAVRRFAGDVAIGLHRDGQDPDGVRAAMKAALEAGDV